MPNPLLECQVQPLHVIASTYIQKFWMLTIIIDVMVCVMETTVDISVRIEIVPIFDFQINVHKHVEEKKSAIWGHFFTLFQGRNTDNNI